MKMTENSDKTNEDRYRKIIRIRTRVQKTTEKLINAVYPPAIYCISCEKPIAGESVYSLCPDCLNDLSWANSRTCPICGKSLEEWYPAQLCAECTNKERTFDSGLTCMQYKDRERKIIHDFKYHGRSYLARHFAAIAKDKLVNDSDKFDLILPVPMYKKKENLRGYNQAAVLARFIAENCKLMYSEHILLRIRSTAPMNRLGVRERDRNLDKAFSIPEDKLQYVEGKRILLVDDIYTTGVTAEHCSRVLKEAGALSVTIFTIAAGINQRVLPVVKSSE